MKNDSTVVANEEPNVMAIGPGRFFMGHFMTIAQELNDAGQHLNVAGVSLRSNDTARDLAAQGNEYTVTTVGEEGHETRTISALSHVYAARDQQDRAAITQLVTSKNLKLITTTVTAAGYYYDGKGGLLMDDPAIQECLNACDSYSVTTTLGFINEALYAQFERGDEPAVVMSLDNMPQNGDKLRIGTYGYALEAVKRGRYNPAYPQWLREKGQFPNTMVDRIVPGKEAKHVEYLADKGVADAIAIKTENFRQLVIGTGDKDVPEILTDLAQASGVQLVEKVERHEHAKIRMLNGTHLLEGIVADLVLREQGVPEEERTVFRAMQEPVVTKVTAQFMNVTAKTLNVPNMVIGSNKNATVDDYADIINGRLRNPHMSDELSRLRRDTSKVKLQERWAKPAYDLLMNGQSTLVHQLEFASYCIFLRGRDLQGQPIDIQDDNAKKMGLPEIADKVVSGEASSKAILDKFNDHNMLEGAGKGLAASKSFIAGTDMLIRRITKNGLGNTINELNFNT